MKLVRQPTPYSCTAACIAMITGVPLEMIFADLGHDGSERPFRFVEYASVLNRYGFHLGGFCDSREAGKHRLVAMSWPRSGPALVITAAAKTTHAIYWNGKRLFDPLGVDKPLENYYVLEWWPVIQFVDEVKRA